MCRQDSHLPAEKPGSVPPSTGGGLAIGSVTAANRVFLAPMSGVTDLAFRRLAHRYGAGLVVSEMVACETLLEGDPETVLRAEGAGVLPHVVQIAGREAHWMAEGARRAEAAGAAVVDINMGCPAKRVTTGWSGSALMRDLDHATTLIEAVVAAVKVPVTVKMRLGWDERTLNAADLARRAESVGAQMVTVHGRTRNQFYKGTADWTLVRAVRAAIAIPLVVNGDVVDAASARAALTASGADAVMVGRGAYGRPWAPARIAAALEDGREMVDPPAAEICEMLVEQVEAMVALYGRALGTRIARKHIGWTFDVVPRADLSARDLKAAILTSEDPAFMTAGIRRWFADADPASAPVARRKAA